MTIGYDKPLYILPFDHRGTFQKNMFGWTGALTDEQSAKIAAMKQVIYGIDVKRVMRSKLVLGVADGWLKADGSIIYRAMDLKVGLFRQDAMQPSGA